MDLRKPAGSEKGTIRSRLCSLGKQQWAVLLLVGLLLAVIAMPVSNDAKKEDTGLFPEEASEDSTEKTVLEQKLEALLENVEGVGRVQVMLMTGEEKDREGFYSSGETEVTGILIAAEGGGDPVTVQNIQQAVMALFQVEAHKIKVMKMK